MYAHRKWIALTAVLLTTVPACDSNDNDTDSSTSTTTSAMVDPSMCPTFETAEDCPSPCGWVSFATWTIENEMCIAGEPLGQCVYQSGDTAAGCGTFDGCLEDPWGYITVDGVLGFRPYCGGTKPPGWHQCTTQDIEGGVPECACACNS